MRRADKQSKGIVKKCVVKARRGLAMKSEGIASPGTEKTRDATDLHGDVKYGQSLEKPSVERQRHCVAESGAG